MGTSRGSASMKFVIKSIINQLDEIYRNEANTKPQDEIENEDSIKQAEIKIHDYENIRSLRENLMNRLRTASEENRNEKIIIFFDSIDQLSKQDYDLEWMFYELPANVKIIYSVLNNYEGIFEKTKNNLQKDNYVVVYPLGLKEAKEIYKTLLGGSYRRLTQVQSNAVDNLLQNTIEIYPLHVKLLFDISSKWTSSYSVPLQFNKCLTIKDTIKYLFKTVEKLFGEVLFSRCIFYLTLFGYKGISESELEDVLSIDDEILTSVFVKHHPPVRRFPIALWLNIKYELKEYITNKETDGLPVISW